MTASVTLVGNLTRDPELRYTPSGASVANFGIAVNRRWRNRETQDWEESTSFFNVTCWRDLAQNVCDSLEKGSRVVLSGRLEQRSWEQNGERRSVVDVIADEVGPSLRWATAEIHRNERRTGDDAVAGDTWSGPPRGDSPADVSDASTSAAPPYDPAEEPF